MLKELVPDVYVLESSFVQSKRGLILDPAGSIMVDTSVVFAETRQMTALADSASLPLSRLILTHSHFDHSAGSELLPDIERIAQRGAGAWMLSDHAARYLAQRPAEHPDLEQMRITLPTLEIDGSAELRLGNRSLSLLPTPGHSPDSMAVLLQPDGILFAGDAVVTCFPPIIQDGSGLDCIASLDKILSLDFRYLVPGHGPVLSRDAALRHCQASLDYLRALCGLLVAIADDDPSSEQLRAVATPALRHLPPGLEMLDHWHAAAIKRLWRECRA